MPFIIAVSFSTKSCYLETSPGLRLFLLTGLLIRSGQWHSLRSLSITVAGPPGNHTPFRFSRPSSSYCRTRGKRGQGSALSHNESNRKTKNSHNQNLTQSMWGTSWIPIPIFQIVQPFLLLVQSWMV